MSPQLLHILQHSLGVDQHGRGSHYRNHFATGPTGPDFDLCNQIVAMGFMRDHGPRELTGSMHTFTVTGNGIDAVAVQSPPAPKLTRAQSRYRAWLNEDSGKSFSQYIRRRFSSSS